MKGRPRQTPADIEARFWAQTKPEGRCLVWTGSFNGSGYGMVYVNSKPRTAHRYSYELANGRTVPPGQMVRHSCDNTRCVKPDHLSLGTAADNTADRIARGRMLKGSGSGHSRVDELQVLEIDRRLKAGEHPVAIAADYGCCRQTIIAIRAGRSWRWLLDAPEERRAEIARAALRATRRMLVEDVAELRRKIKEIQVAIGRVDDRIAAFDDTGLVLPLVRAGGAA